MRELFARARSNAWLTPGERALLKLFEGLLCAGLVAALPVAAGALGHAGVQWSDVGRTALAAGTVAALLALAKYLKAHGDPVLGDTLGAVASDLTPAVSPVGAGSKDAVMAGAVSPSAPLLARRGEPESSPAGGLSDASAGDGSAPESAPVPVGPAQPETVAAGEAQRTA